MSFMKDATEHFGEEAPHTAIKHKLFKSVFDSCISISSSFNNTKKELLHILICMQVVENLKIIILVHH